MSDTASFDDRFMPLQPVPGMTPNNIQNTLMSAIQGGQGSLPPQLLGSIMSMFMPGYRPGPGWGGTTPNPMTTWRNDRDFQWETAAMKYIRPSEIRTASSRAKQIFQMFGADEADASSLGRQAATFLDDTGLMGFAAPYLMPGGSSRDLVMGARQATRGRWADAGKEKQGTVRGWDPTQVGMFVQGLEGYFYGGGPGGVSEVMDRTRGLTRREIGELTSGLQGAGLMGVPSGAGANISEQMQTMGGKIAEYTRVIQAAKDVFGQDKGIPAMLEAIKNMTGGQMANVDAAHLESSLYKIKALSDVLNKSSEEVANYLQSVGRIAQAHGLEGKAAIDLGMDVMHSQAAAVESGALQKFQVSEDQMLQAITAERIGVQRSAYTQRLSGLMHLATTQDADKAMGGLGKDDPARELIANIRELRDPNTTDERKAEVQAKIGQLMEADPYLHRRAYQAFGLGEAGIRSLENNEEYVKMYGQEVTPVVQEMRKKSIIQNLAFTDQGLFNTQRELMRKLNKDQITPEVRAKIEDAMSDLVFNTDKEEDVVKTITELNKSANLGLTTEEIAAQAAAAHNVARTTRKNNAYLATYTKDHQEQLKRLREETNKQALVSVLTAGDVQRFDFGSFLEKIADKGETMGAVEIAKAFGVIIDDKKEADEWLKGTGIDKLVRTRAEQERRIAAGEFENMSKEEKAKFIDQRIENKKALEKSLAEAREKKMSERGSVDRLEKIYSKADWTSKVTVNGKEVEFGEYLKANRGDSEKMMAAINAMRQKTGKEMDFTKNWEESKKYGTLSEDLNAVGMSIDLKGFEGDKAKFQGIVARRMMGEDLTDDEATWLRTLKQFKDKKGKELARMSGAELAGQVGEVSYSEGKDEKKIAEALKARSDKALEQKTEEEAIKRKEKEARDKNKTEEQKKKEAEEKKAGDKGKSEERTVALNVEVKEKVLPVRLNVFGRGQALLNLFASASADMPGQNTTSV